LPAIHDVQPTTPSSSRAAQDDKLNSDIFFVDEGAVLGLASVGKMRLLLRELKLEPGKHVERSGTTTETVQVDQFRFDPYVGAAVLGELAELVSREPPQRWLDLTEPMFVSATAVLRDAKTWLEQYRTPFDHFAGDVLLEASKDRLLISIDTFGSVLGAAALDLVTVARLVELRDVRMRRAEMARLALEAKP